MKPNLLQLNNPRTSTPNLVAMIDILDARPAETVSDIFGFRR
jgi:hypothetical protein